MSSKDVAKIWYVYMLCDPDTEVPFYIGKGTGNRIEQHERYMTLYSPNEEKKAIIRRILSEGKQVLKKKVAEFKDEQEALKYESALIEAHKEHLTNIRGGVKRPKARIGEMSKVNEVVPRVSFDSRPDDEILTPQEVAEYLKVPVKLVSHIAAKGDIDAFKIGKRWRIIKSDLVKFIERQLR